MGDAAQGRHGLFRYGAFVAARGHRPSINVRISPPEHLARYNAQSCTKFRPLRVWRDGYRLTCFAFNPHEIAYDLYLLNIVVRDFNAREFILNR
jgi:hypothetical protein